MPARGRGRYPRPRAVDAAREAASYEGGRIPRDEMFERAGDLAERLEGDARIKRGGIELLVPEEHLDHADVSLLLQQMRGEAVPQRVQRDGLVDLGHLRGGMAGPVELPRRERVDRVLPGKQPALRAPRLPPRAQQFEQVLGQHDVAVLAALALLNPDDHPGAVDVGDLERDDLGRPVGGSETTYSAAEALKRVGPARDGALKIGAGRPETARKKPETPRGCLGGIVPPPAPLAAENPNLTGDASAEEARNL